VKPIEKVGHNSHHPTFPLSSVESWAESPESGRCGLFVSKYDTYS
jgi:hypothetical protein